MDSEDRIILSLRAMAVLENIQRVLRVACATSGVFDWVRHVGKHLVDDHIHILVEEPLASVRKAASFEGVVLGDD